MNESLPPPIPSGTPQRNTGEQPGSPPPGRGPDATYNLLADKIGGVPNIRKKDNLYQAITVGVFLIIGVIVGWFAGEWPEGVLLGALGGLIAGTSISGAVFLVLGLRGKSLVNLEGRGGGQKLTRIPKSRVVARASSLHRRASSSLSDLAGVDE